MRKGRDGEWNKKWRMENNGENSGPLTLLPVDCQNAAACNADARANFGQIKCNCTQKNGYQNIIQK